MLYNGTLTLCHYLPGVSWKEALANNARKDYQELNERKYSIPCPTEANEKDLMTTRQGWLISVATCQQPWSTLEPCWPQKVGDQQMLGSDWYLNPRCPSRKRVPNQRICSQLKECYSTLFFYHTSTEPAFSAGSWRALVPVRQPALKSGD